MLPDPGRVPSGPGGILFDQQDAPCAGDRHRRHWSGTQAKGTVASGVPSTIAPDPTPAILIVGVGFEVLWRLRHGTNALVRDH
jgi:hypothetical protein